MLRRHACVSWAGGIASHGSFRTSPLISTSQSITPREKALACNATQSKKKVRIVEKRVFKCRSCSDHEQITRISKLGRVGT